MQSGHLSLELGKRTHAKTDYSVNYVAGLISLSLEGVFTVRREGGGRYSTGSNLIYLS